MSRKFGGRLIRIMMTKSSSCDILKKKRTIRRGSGSRPKGSYLMDLRFWNYVIPDGSTTSLRLYNSTFMFWNYVIPDGSTTRSFCERGLTRFWNYVIPDGSTTLQQWRRRSFCFGTMSFQMVLLLVPCLKQFSRVLELCHSRWFYYRTCSSMPGCFVLELCHSRWFYYCRRWRKHLSCVLELCHSRWFYY